MRACLLAFVLAGCGLYWDNPPDPPPDCAGGADIPNIELRDPSNGQCVDYSRPLCGCSPCPGGFDLPGYAECNGPCEALDEASCLAAPGCHAAYLDPSDNLQRTPQFWGCWEVEPTGPLEGSCTGLDPYTCTAHDDCIGVYSSSDAFEQCAPEPDALPACSTLTTEDACKARPDCDPIYTGSNCTCDEHGCTCATETFEYCGGDPTACDNLGCSDGNECAIAHDGAAQCVAPSVAGSCTGTVACDIAVDCPAGTTPGIDGICYTSWCIPLDECGGEIH